MEWALSWIILVLATKQPDEIFSLSGRKLEIIQMTSCCKLSQTLSASRFWRSSSPASGSFLGLLLPLSSDSGIDGAFRWCPTICGSYRISSSLTSSAVSALLCFVAWAVVLACQGDLKGLGGKGTFSTCQVMLLLHEVGGPSILSVQKRACTLSHRLGLEATPSRIFESLWFWWMRNYCHLVSNTSIHQKTLLHQELMPVETCSTVLWDGIVGKWNDRVFEYPASRVRECGWGGGGDEHNLVTAPLYDQYCTVTDPEFEILGLSGDKDLPNKLVRSVIPCTAKIMHICKGCGLKVKHSGCNGFAIP